MRRVVLVGVGVLVTLAGVIFTLQGVGVLGGSVMSGVTFWAVAGPVIALAGLAIAAIGLRGGLASQVRRLCLTCDWYGDTAIFSPPGPRGAAGRRFVALRRRLRSGELGAGRDSPAEFTSTRSHRVQSSSLPESCATAGRPRRPRSLRSRGGTARHPDPHRPGGRGAVARLVLRGPVVPGPESRAGRRQLRSPGLRGRRDHQGSSLHPLRERRADAPQPFQRHGAGRAPPASPGSRRRRAAGLPGDGVPQGRHRLAAQRDPSSARPVADHAAGHDGRGPGRDDLGLLGALVPGLPYRQEPRNHPYTRHGRQVDVLQGGRWVEVWECGLAHPGVLAAAGLRRPWRPGPGYGP